jgi:hypothetical protein
MPQSLEQIMIQEQKTKQQVLIVLSKDAGSNHSKSRRSIWASLQCDTFVFFSLP